MPAKLEPITSAPHAYASTATDLRKRLTEGEAQYLAGLIDGEGAIFIGTANQAGKQYFNADVKIAVCHTMIIDLCNRYGGFWSYQTRKREPTKYNEPRKPIFRWEWNGEMIKRYLPQILPYLLIKQEQAKLLLEARNLGRLPRKEGRQQHLDKLKELQKQIKELNNKTFTIDTTKYEHLRKKPATRF